MPEIGEVARIVHFLRKYLVNQRVASVTAQEDPKIYHTAKTDLTAATLSSSLKDRTVVDAAQQGKYFWIVMDKPPHLLMHFGMTGWIKFKHDETAYYKPMRERKKEEKERQKREDEGQEEDGPEEDEPEAQDWPPRFWKFILHTTSSPAIEAAFTDSRRFGRVQLLDCPAPEIRKVSPLKENGPDPVVDSNILTAEWLANKLQSRRVPVKALILDQSCISGIGNWVADEILFQARVHPEQYSNTMSREQAGALHEKMAEVCGTACALLADSSRFPGHWLMRHRWDKGKKEASRLPSGEKIEHLNVGGRTSAVVPSLQKKMGPVAKEAGGNEAGEEDEEEDDGDEGKKASGKQKSSGGRGRSAKGQSVRKGGQANDGESEAPTASSKKRKPSRGRKETEESATGGAGDQQKAKKQRTARTVEAVSSRTPPRRRSARYSR